jgi:hypothetical protein
MIWYKAIQNTQLPALVLKKRKKKSVFNVLHFNSNCERQLHMTNPEAIGNINVTKLEL